MTPSTNLLDPLTKVNCIKGRPKKNLNENSILKPLRVSSEPSTSQCELLPLLSELKLIKKTEVLALVGFSKSTLHVRINNGLMPPSVPLGERAVAFVQHEIQVVLAAQVAGRSDEDIKQLVIDLVTLRQDIYEREVKSCNM
tara:strand:+ start:183 stop:605 length:423 start_codon:yes stop_codon:yes gene_type:complete